MFRFEAFEEPHLLEFLWQGLLDEYIEDLLKRWEVFSPKIQFELICYVRERLKESLNPKVLAKALKIKIFDAEKIIADKDKNFEIFLVESEEDENKALSVKTCKAFAIPETSKIITNLPHIRKHLLTIKKFLGKSFAVFFEDSFIGKSFMLPLAVALDIEKIPEDLRFTGGLNTKGDILEVDYIREKLEYAKKQGFRLITPFQVKNFSTIKTYLEKEKWDIPFYITNAGRDEFLTFLETYKGEKTIAEFEVLKGIELFYGLSEGNFFIITGQLTSKKNWERVCKSFYKRLYQIKNRLPGIKTYHLGMRGAVALGFALGVLFSHFDPFVFYHYQTVEGIAKYHPIYVEEPRFLKERQKEYKYLNPKFEKQGEDLVIVLNFSHHEPTADVKKYVASFLKDPSFLILETEFKGNLPIENFLEVAKESASFIQNIREEYSFNSYHFFFSCPVAIAFMVGLAFGHYVDGFIYNYQKEKTLYQPVLDFKFLRKIREGDVRN
uniref:SAVED domain-containing protein n=1 Tax=Thermodesulfobacterium geofontis TaxID=1295609 RepID=A0A7V5XFC8_9BACT